MVLVLVALFLVLPFVELAVIVAASDSIGLGWTLLLLVAVSVLGGWLVKREGVGVVRRVQEQLGAGELPAREMLDGALILFAGALMMTPGFVTDVVGLLLLVPPSRALVRSVLLVRLRRRIDLAVVGGVPGGSIFTEGVVPPRRPGGPVVDVDEAPPRHHQPGRITRPELEGP